VDDLQGALRQLRAQLAACGGLETAAPADPHAGHAMPSMPQAPAAPAVPPVMKPGPTTPAPSAEAPSRAPAAADPHAGHTMPKPQMVPVAPGGKPVQKSGSAKPAPAAPARPAAARDPHAGHDTSAQAAKEVTGTKQAKVMDPVTGLMVDPTAAPKTTYQGRTYYFSSEQAREEFLQNPAKFVKKPKP
jgi:YHS domain-containing protein